MKKINKYNIFRYTLSIVFAVIISTNLAKGQETSPNGELGWAEGWRYAFSTEGIKNWKPEFTLRYELGFYSAGPTFTAGVKVDDKRTFALLFKQGHYYYDAIPASIETINFALNFRRYWHLGSRKVTAFYSDLYLGGGCIYKTSRSDMDEKVGDVIPIIGWQPGFRIRIYKNFHIFLGPTISNDCIGVHLGIGV